MDATGATVAVLSGILLLVLGAIGAVASYEGEEDPSGAESSDWPQQLRWWCSAGLAVLGVGLIVLPIVVSPEHVTW